MQIGLAELLQNGLKLKGSRGLYGFTPLHHACNRGHMNVVSQLLKAGVDINETNDSGETALHLACYSGRLLIVDLLLDKGANINAVNQYGESALFYAVRRKSYALARVLLQRGADPTIEDRYGDKAIDHAEDERMRNEFYQKHVVDARRGQLNHDDLLYIYKYLNAKDICRCALVSGKWHRVSQTEELWARLGIRRWELALTASLGFQTAPAASFSRRSSSKDNASSSSLTRK